MRLVFEARAYHEAVPVLVSYLSPSFNLVLDPVFCGFVSSSSGMTCLDVHMHDIEIYRIPRFWTSWEAWNGNQPAP